MNLKKFHREADYWHWLQGEKKTPNTRRLEPSNPFALQRILMTADLPGSNIQIPWCKHKSSLRGVLLLGIWLAEPIRTFSASFHRSWILGRGQFRWVKFPSACESGGRWPGSTLFSEICIYAQLPANRFEQYSHPFQFLVKITSPGLFFYI